MVVEAANWPARVAILTDGTTVPVTHLFDADGDETSDTSEAVSFVAGEGDLWFSGLCADYEAVETH
jgi:hypothetical protein